MNTVGDVPAALSCCCLKPRIVLSAPGIVASGPSVPSRFGLVRRPDDWSLPLVATKKIPGAGLAAGMETAPFGSDPEQVWNRLV